MLLIPISLWKVLRYTPKVFSVDTFCSLSLVIDTPRPLMTPLGDVDSRTQSP